jgi:hypothetical protein
MTAHTPTPWTAEKVGFEIARIVDATDGPVIRSGIDAQLAAHIVHCVNEREGLLRALKNCVNRLRNQPGSSVITEGMNETAWRQAEAILALAEQES